MSTRLMEGSLHADNRSTLQDNRSIWHASEATEALLALGSGGHGLDQAEASRRLETYGPNLLTEAPPPGLLERLARQFNNLLLTPRVLAAVTGVFALQLFFTYAPVMQQLFRTEALPLAWGFRIIAVGVVLLMILEVEKAVLRRLGAVA